MVNQNLATIEAAGRGVLTARTAREIALSGEVIPPPTLGLDGARYWNAAELYCLDYPTPDGTGVCDYIHVMDLADGHVDALKGITKRNQAYSVWNLGTGIRYSVLELVAAFERASGQNLPYTFAPSRSGDVTISYASPELARKELDWQARLGLDEMCASTWRFEELLRAANRAQDQESTPKP